MAEEKCVRDVRDSLWQSAIHTKKKSWKRQGQGNSWDQYHDSSSAASPSTSVEEGGKETHIMSERGEQVGTTAARMGSKYVQPAQPYRLQQANRGQSKWSEWAREVRHSQPQYKDYGSTEWQASAGDASAWDKYYSLLPNISTLAVLISRENPHANHQNWVPKMNFVEFPGSGLSVEILHKP